MKRNPSRHKHKIVIAGISIHTLEDVEKVGMGHATHADFSDSL
jgi:hypothetical protein